MEQVLGNSVGVFIGLTVLLFGGAGFMTGQALAQNWRPIWPLLPYSLLLAAGNRFLGFALFGGELLSLSGYLIAFVVIGFLTVFAYQAMRARKMVYQYPWLYRRKGLFGWEELPGGGEQS